MWARRRFTCEHVMRVLRANKDSVMAMLEAFVHDPLINWRLLNHADADAPEHADTARASFIFFSSLCCCINPISCFPPCAVLWQSLLGPVRVVLVKLARPSCLSLLNAPWVVGWVGWVGLGGLGRRSGLFSHRGRHT
jgi:hypothetical protein